MNRFCESVLSGLPAGVTVFNREGTLVFANNEARRILGIPEEAPLSGIKSPPGWPDTRQVMAADGSRVDLIPGAGDREELLIHSSPLADDGQVAGMISLFFPSRRLSSAAAGETKAREKTARDLEAIIENTYDGLYITDGNAVTLMVNRAYERITGIRKEEVLGKSMKDLVDSGTFNRSVTIDVLESRKPITIMQELRGGKKVLVTGSPVFDEKGEEIVLVVTNVRDITELVELKDKLHEKSLEANRYFAELDKIKTLQHQKAKFVTKSRKMAELLDTTIRAAQFDSNILITGESGVGKGLLATLIHEASHRKDHPFVTINCAGIPEDLFESELFGYDPGAFSGASTKGKKGLLEVGDKGSVFLDEIGDMSLRLQSKLLRVIEEKEMTRLGSTKTIKLNVRIIAATNQEIPALIEAKKFRQDLYFRLNTIHLVVPPLRDRVEDVIPLMQHFTARLNERYHLSKHFSPRASQLIMSYQFPGNVRELSNVVEQAFLISKNDLIDVDDLPFQVRSMAESDTVVLGAEDKSYDEMVNFMEYKILKAALEKYGSTHKVARQLGISQSTVVRKLKKLNITRSDS